LAVLRIVANFVASDPDQARAFYCDLLGLDVAMDLGWILTLAPQEAEAKAQISFAREGGSGMPVPDLTVEVDDFEHVLQKVRSQELPVEYGPVDEPWGVKRFFVRDPFGRLVNVMTHSLDG